MRCLLSKVHICLVGTLLILVCHRAQVCLAQPIYCTAAHDVGRYGLMVTNGGTLGVLPHISGTGPTGYVQYPFDSSGCYIGRIFNQPIWDISADEYPVGSGTHSIHFGALWIGGITEENDTLVSVAQDGWHGIYELYASPGPSGEVRARSRNEDGNEEAYSEQDYLCSYSDTATTGRPGLLPDPFSHRAHKPLGIQVDQTSCAWSSTLANDFVIIEYKVTNIGAGDLREMNIGLFLEVGVGYAVAGSSPFCFQCDDMCGFKPMLLSPSACGPFEDSIHLAWFADNDGNPYESKWVEAGESKSTRSVSGATILKSPDPDASVSFNWWSPSRDPRFDYGPRYRRFQESPYTDFWTGGTGTPEGDRNKYHLLSNGEIDPDVPLLSRIPPTDPIWAYPTEYARTWVWRGSDIRLLLSTGPFSLEKNEQATFVIALVGGESFHNDPYNTDYLIAGDLDRWYAQTDLTDLSKNAQQARWVYDNPGVDTDGDGYRGKAHICVLDSVLNDSVWVINVAETTYYTGDGVADWREVGPPPPPRVWLVPFDGGIRVRFNGKDSETTRDLVNNRIDFEGYRIYVGRDDREASLSLAAEYDIENFDKFVWNSNAYPTGEYQVQEVPFSKQELRCWYGGGSTPCNDSLFDPLSFTPANPYRLSGFANDSLFYFLPHGFNTDRLGVETNIRKVYPNTPKPDLSRPIPKDAYTEDGYLKYYEYECVLENLLPTVPYYLNVTAFDHGDPSAGVEALESSRVLGLQDCFPLQNANLSGATAKPVYVYPNPYRVDDKYRTSGYEGRNSERIDDRERRIHFANLPAQCTIRIHTLDGDLVREIRHDVPDDDPASDHDTWDLINRNIMTVESGLYYWSVEDVNGKVQLGTLVIIK